MDLGKKLLRMGNWRNFNAVFFSMQMLIVLVMSHFMLWHGEPEGYLEIFKQRAFVEQFVVHVIIFTALCFFMRRIYRSAFQMGDRPLNMSRRMTMLVLKAWIFPLLVSVLFGYFYFSYFGHPWSLTDYMQRIFPLAVMLVIMVNLMYLLRYMMILFVTMLAQPSRVSMLGLGLQDQGRDAEDGVSHALLIDAVESTTDPVAVDQEGVLVEEKLQLSYSRRLYTADRDELVYACLEDHSVRVYLSDQKRCRYSGSLRQLIDWLGQDARFYATGTWVISRKYIDRIERTHSRTRLVYLKFPFQTNFSLSKEKVSEFLEWWEQGVPNE